MNDNVFKDEKRLADMADMAGRLAGLGYWRMDVTTEALTWSANMFRLLDFPIDRQPTLEEVLARVHPADRLTTEHRLVSTLSGNAPSSNSRYLLPDGRTVHLESRHTAEYDDKGRMVAIFGVTMDVSHRVAAEQAVRESEHRFRMLAENATDMIVSFDGHGVISYISPVCKAILGYAPKELIGRKTTDVIHADDVERVYKAFQTYVAKGPGAPSHRIQYRALHKKGRTVWLEAHPRAIYDTLTDRLIEIQDVVRDISEQQEGALRVA